MVTVPTVEPTEFFAGDTVAWRREDLSGDFAANASWVLNYYLRGPSAPATIAASASGVYFAVSVPASTTKDWNEGIYWWAAIVSKAGETYTVGTGTFTVKKNFALADAVYDGRSHVKITLDNLEATLQSLSAEPLASYSVAQRTAVRQSIEVFAKLRDEYAAKYAAEVAKANLDQGQSSGRKILARF